MPEQAQPVAPIAPKGQQGTLEVPLDIVGSTTFGRYPKINRSETTNMMISDNALVDYAGYAAVLQLSDNPGAQGRGIFSSVVHNLLFVVISDAAFVVNSNLVPLFIGHLQTATGEVFITENNNNQICFSDNEFIYIYNVHTFAFTQVVTDFKPGFLAFQDTRFLTPAVGTSTWRLSDFNNGLSWPNDSQHVGELQTKPDTVQAIVPMPARGNMAFVFGTTVSEQWNDVGAALFPYQKNNSFNVDYGCINPSSIAYQGSFIAWIGVNEEAGAVVMYTEGGNLIEVSTDGIDYKLSQLTNPEDCSGFLVKVDGHLFYQFTFKTDNLSYLYDFTTKKFFTVTDENMNIHIARKIVYFNNTYFFVSYTDGKLYEFGTQYTNYTYSLPGAVNPIVKEIPRIRTCSPIRLANQRPFIVKSLSFTIEQGQENTGDNMAVDLTVSRDGGETFSNSQRNEMNPTGQRTSRFIYQRLGRANDFTAQIQFWGQNRFIALDGIVELYT